MPEDKLIALMRHSFYYCPSTGDLTWRNPKCTRVKRGDKAGSVARRPRATPKLVPCEVDGRAAFRFVMTHAYPVVRLRGKMHHMSQVVVAVHTGEFPSGKVIASDGNSFNLAWANLRYNGQR